MMEDKDFLEKLKIGDIPAFDTLVSTHRKKVINTCYKFLLNKEEAEDIAQEVFIEVFQSIKSFRGEANISSWIYRIAVTKSLDEIKKRKRKKRITSVGKMLHLDGLANWIVGGNMPDKQLIEQETSKEIMQALDKLPDNQRIAFTLSKIDGYNNTEIAEIMATTLIAVESLISRAKKKLSATLEKILI